VGYLICQSVFPKNSDKIYLALREDYWQLLPCGCLPALVGSSVDL